MGTWTPGSAATAGNDTFTGTGADETADGLAGNDTLIGGGGTDILIGNDGNDVFVINAVSDLSPGDSYLGDNFPSDGGFDTMRLTVGGVFNFAGVHLLGIETLTLAANSTLDFLQDNDVSVSIDALNINAQGHAATLNIAASASGFGGVDISSWTFTNGTFTINMSATTNGDYSFFGSSLADTITGAAGRDQLHGGGGVDTLIGGAGDDIYFIDSAADANDQIIETSTGGMDTVETFVSYSLAGTAFVERIVGEVSGLTLSGNGGDNTLAGRGGDTLMGGLGNDTYVIRAGDTTSTILENANAGTDTVEFNFLFNSAKFSIESIANVENLHVVIEGFTSGTQPTITATGNTLDNVITIDQSHVTNDVIDGGNGDDILTSGAGNDMLFGGAGNDTISAGAGDDYVAYNTSTGVDQIDGGAGIDTIALDLSALTLGITLNQATLIAGLSLANGAHITNMERIGSTFTTSGGDTLDIRGGFFSSGQLDGGEGVDTLIADYSSQTGAINLSPAAANALFLTFAGVVDSIYITNFEILNFVGGTGNDALYGFAGNDTINGGAGADSIQGGLGDDALIGGTSVDTANYASASTSDSWHRDLDGSWMIVAGAEGTDTLTGVEFAHFTDRDVFLARAAETFSGDGTSDIFLRNASSGALAMWSLNGATITGSDPGSIGASFTSLGYGDMNGDGRDDILWRDTSGNVSLWEMNGSVHTAISLGNVSTVWSVAGIGDLNGDLIDDILWRNGSGDMSIWFQDSNGGHTSASLGNVSPDWKIEAFGDFNGDGKQDFLWRNTVSGDMSLWFMNGTSVTGGQFAHVGQPWVVEGTGDFDGDGRDDVVWRNSVTGDMSIWMMNGQTLVSQPGYSVGPTWHIEAVGDYNGDGKDDLIWRNDDGTMVEWLMNGGAITSTFSPGSLDQAWIINPGG